MTSSNPTKKQIETLEAQIRADQSRPVRENERRVRIGATLKGAVRKMANTKPIGNKDLAKWSKKQRKDVK